eukprot:m.32496 g.32496  ORF g.32496 m.32496 type:complete len:873 (+) comp4895_c0_seq1:37-2655(+)
MDPKAALDDAAFEELEMEFQQTLASLSTDPALANFKLEYEKLHSVLATSHESEKRLMAKCRELNADLVTAAAKVESVAQDSYANDQAMELNNKELEQAWETINEYRDQEKELKDQVSSLQDDVAELQEKIREAETVNDDQEDITDLMDEKAALQGKLDEATDEVLELRSEVDAVRAKQITAEKARDAALEEVAALNDAMARAKAEHEKEARKKLALERECGLLQHDLAAAEKQIESKQMSIGDHQEELGKVQKRLSTSAKEIEKLKQSVDALTQNNARLERQRDNTIAELDRAQDDIHTGRRQLKEKEAEMVRLKKDLAEAERFGDKLKKELKASEQARLDMDAKRNAMSTDNAGLQRDLEALKRQVEQDRKTLEAVTRERDMLQKKTLVAGSETEAQREMVKQQAARVKSLEQDIATYKAEARDQRRAIHALEKERDRFIAESAQSSASCLQALEEAKMADGKMVDFQKQIARAELRLKQQTSLYEQCRSERNLYNKNFLESQDEITEKKRKLKIMNHQIEQLKEEITSKEQKLGKKHVQLEEIEQDRVKLTAMVDEVRHKNDKLAATISTLETEKNQLSTILQKGQLEREHQLKQYDEVIKERDMLATQLTRRDDELKLVYEKYKIQQSTLSKGEVQYRSRLDDIRLLKMEIKRLKREKVILSKTVSNVEDLKKELHSAQRDLLRERTRCRALEEELETPMNVHRWRKLEGTDPAMYEKIQKIQTLQKRLIAKTEETVEKEMLLHQKEKEYLELKQVLARQPGPEVAEQLQVYQQAVKEKTRQLQSMASELNMFQAESTEYKYEIERLARELQDTKKRYFDTKRKELAVRERNQALHAPPSAAISASPTRFAGGGFKMTTTTTTEDHQLS